MVDMRVYQGFKMRIRAGLEAMTPVERAAWVEEYLAKKEVKEVVEVEVTSLDEWEF